MQKLWGTKSASTWNVALAAVRDLEMELQELGKRSKPLLPDTVTYRRKPARLPKPVSEAEVKRLFEEVTDPQDKLLFEILAGSGLRASEAAHLRFGDINPDGVLRIIGKGNKERQTFLTGPAMQALKEWALVGHLGLEIDDPGKREEVYWKFANENPETGVFLGAYKPVVELAKPHDWVWQHVRKYTDDHPHKFRHFWVTDLLNNGADAMAVADAAGHASLSTTRNYKKVLARETTALRAKHSREQRLL